MRISKIQKYWLPVEFILLCAVLPTLIIYFRLAPYMFAFLWGSALYCAIIYQRHFFKGFKELWRWEEVTWPHLKPLLIRFVFAAIGMTLFLWWYNPDRLFEFAKYNPIFILVLFTLYPVLSALPQEFIFCSFFFKRYERFFGTGKKMIIASAIVFGYAHMLFINPVAPTLSLIAGFIFASTYAKHKSLALITIEHGLYGNYLFLVGLGWYFYGGAVM